MRQGRTALQVGADLQHSHEWEVNGPDQEKRYGEQDAADRIELSQEGAAVEEVRKVIRVEDVDNNQENTCGDKCVHAACAPSVAA
mgnify:CR=1 FL=1|jgi:hypothetical protein